MLGEWLMVAIVQLFKGIVSVDFSVPALKHLIYNQRIHGYSTVDIMGPLNVNVLEILCK